MSDVQHVPGPYVPLRAGRPRDVELGRLADNQHGVVSLTQLKALGLTSSGVRKRVARGNLHRIHRGVYAVGRARLTGHGRGMAAVLACGPRAALSHRSAAALHGLRPDNRRVTDVSVPGRSVRQRPGIVVHGSETLAPEEIEVVDGIPCTTIARTLFDLARVAGRREVEKAISQAEVLRTYYGRALGALLKQATRHRGTGLLRSVLDRYAGPALTESELEERFLALCDEAGLPRPAVGAWIALDGNHVKVDFLWRDARLIVETDGHQVHGTREAFERDRRRDQRLALARYRVVRVTWRQVLEEPGRVAATVGTLLG